MEINNLAMKLNIGSKYTIRFSNRMILISSITGVSAFILIGVFSNLFSIRPETSEANPCINSFILDWSDPSTYSITCGSVNAANWTVRNRKCIYSSPLFNSGGNSGDPDFTAEIQVRINQSGNLISSDSAWVQYFVNNTIVRTDAFTGDGSPAVFTSSAILQIPAQSTYQIKITLRTGATNRFWQIKNGDITACLSSSVLPIQLKKFTATLQNQNVLLNWETLSEKENDYFTIHRSDDDNSMTEIVRIPGAGNSNTLLKYSYTDKDIPSGNVYYTLSQTDINGDITTFNSVIVNYFPKIKVNSISPNPFISALDVHLLCYEDMNNTISIVSMDGRIIYRSQYKTNIGNNTLKIRLNEPIATGAYLLILSDDYNNVIWTERLIHQDK